jgi:hypothetical protein
MFSSYCIYSAVFLYRARLFGALEVTGEGEEVMKLFRRLMKALENCASSDRHIGRRYNKLLERLWFPALGLTVADSQMTPAELHNNTVSASNTVQNTSIPDLIEMSQTLQPESQDSVLETMVSIPSVAAFTALKQTFSDSCRKTTSTFKDQIRTTSNHQSLPFAIPFP